ncbi:MAG: hypothetical protein SPI76_02275, partial [Candidatus Fimenecus sp.]|nr:hypothetical protein [Candidatus Fimenecus sp.]
PSNTLHITKNRCTVYSFSVHLFSFLGYYTAVRNPQKLVATVSRREGVYNRTGKPSVIFAEKEELRSE